MLWRLVHHYCYWCAGMSPPKLTECGSNIVVYWSQEPRLGDANDIMISWYSNDEVEHNKHKMKVWIPNDFFRWYVQLVSSWILQFVSDNFPMDMISSSDAKSEWINVQILKCSDNCKGTYHNGWPSLNLLSTQRVAHVTLSAISHPNGGLWGKELEIVVVGFHHTRISLKLLNCNLSI